MPPLGLEPTIPAIARPQTCALDRAATGIGFLFSKGKGSLCNRSWGPKRGSRGVAVPVREPRHEEGMGWLAPRPGRFIPGKETQYPSYRRLGGPQGRSGRLRKISPPPGFDPRIVQAAASRYTDWAIPAHASCLVLGLKHIGLLKYWIWGWVREITTVTEAQTEPWK
jgi:hypothetical protein